ncbi:MAG: flagellar protein FlgN [Desulfuromonas sp.]|uniref:hypothetical protein n=1 Tax=Desulfuromonas sp. TaxID=892 RepID=UPI000CCAC58A|nr:hypothetical protein [Desulfuromonas sp.]PLX84470.1 MAG: flagellar protein FlgN [Desulfuromonas sp.]
MSEQGLHGQLTELHRLILRERECAKALDLEQMSAATRQKEDLVRCLPSAAEADEKIHSLAAVVREENRRNAYLLWSALNWVRETMQFFGQQGTSPGYGTGGGEARAAAAGRLLSGRA